MTWPDAGTELVLTSEVFPDRAKPTAAAACFGVAFEPPAVA